MKTKIILICLMVAVNLPTFATGTDSTMKTQEITIVAETENILLPDTMIQIGKAIFEVEEGELKVDLTFDTWKHTRVFTAKKCHFGKGNNELTLVVPFGTDVSITLKLGDDDFKKLKKLCSKICIKK